MRFSNRTRSTFLDQHASAIQYDRVTNRRNTDPADFMRHVDLHTYGIPMQQRFTKINPETCSFNNSRNDILVVIKRRLAMCFSKHLGYFGYMAIVPSRQSGVLSNTQDVTAVQHDLVGRQHR
jgi:hypothetical protein